MNIALNAADKWTAIIIITMIILSVYWPIKMMDRKNIKYLQQTSS